MPFEKGNKLGKGQGRKGYEVEKAQLDKMSKIVGMDLNLVEKIYKGQGKEEDFKKIQALQVRVSKYLDKLHATKEHTEVTGNFQVSIDPESLDKINKAIDELL